MRSLIDEARCRLSALVSPDPASRRAAGPGPSRLAYRLSRAWAKPRVRSAVTVYLPLVALGLLGWRLAADDGIRRAVEAEIAAQADRLIARPEFALREITVAGASPRLHARIEETVPLEDHASSLRFDVEAVRETLEGIGAVRSADVRLDPAGIVAIRVVERLPIALWRDGDGALRFLDQDGVVFGRPKARANHAALPLVLGEGAPGAIVEAMRLYAGAPGLQPRMRALVRVGARRWDIVLDEGLTLMLPEHDPDAALTAAVDLHRTRGVLGARLAAVDFRTGGEPVLRLKPDAVGDYLERREQRLNPGERT